VSIYKVYNGKGARAVREMMKNKDEKLYNFIAAAGEAPAMGTAQLGAKANLASGDIGRAADALDTMNKAGLKRVLKIPLTSLGTIDRWKASLIRRGVAADYVDKRLNGFQAKVKSLVGVEEEVFRLLKDKPLDEQIRFFASNHKLRNEMAQYMEDVMGEWNALTSFEKVPAPVLMFYPFLRMSLRVTLWGFPKQHPVKFAILTTLGASNAEQLRDLLEGPQQESEGGEPSIFAGFAQPAIYGADETTADNPYGVSQTINLSRAVPGANALLEGVFGGNPWLAPVRIAQPLVGIGVSIATGEQAFGQSVEEKDRALNALHQLLSLPAPLRLFDQLDKNFLEGVPVVGDLADPLARFMNRNEDPEGTLSTRVGGRSGSEQLLPFLPQSLREARGMSQLSDLYERKNDLPSEQEILDIAGRYVEARQAFNRSKNADSERDLREIAVELKSVISRARSAEKAKNRLAGLGKQYGITPMTKQEIEDFTNVWAMATGRKQSPIDFWLSGRKGPPPPSYDTAADKYFWQAMRVKRPKVRRGGRIVGLTDNTGTSGSRYSQQIVRRSR
jgi:hypothetical protein